MLPRFFQKREDRFDYETQRECKNCGEVFHGRFCNRCGQKVIEPNERTIRFFLAKVFNAFTFIDGKFWHSLKCLLLKPGQMSADISNGKGKPYMQPVGLFFVGNLIYFLFPIFQTFNSGLYSQMGYMIYSKPLRISAYVKEHVEEKGITLDEFEKSYAAKSKEIAKTTLIIIVVFISIFFAAIFYTNNRLFSDHLLFGLEFSNFMIHYLTNLLGAILLLSGALLSLFDSGTNLIRDDVFFAVAVPLALYFLVRGIRVFYSTTWARASAKAVLCLVALILSIEMFRLSVFILTMSSL